MRIDFVNMPDISGKSTQEALRILSNTLHDTMVKVMELNNTVEDLKTKVRAIKG